MRLHWEILVAFSAVFLHGCIPDRPDVPGHVPKLQQPPQVIWSPSSDELIGLQSFRAYAENKLHRPIPLEKLKHICNNPVACFIIVGAAGGLQVLSGSQAASKIVMEEGEFAADQTALSQDLQHIQEDINGLLTELKGFRDITDIVDAQSTADLESMVTIILSELVDINTKVTSLLIEAKLANEKNVLCVPITNGTPCPVVIPQSVLTDYTQMQTDSQRMLGGLQAMKVCQAGCSVMRWMVLLGKVSAAETDMCHDQFNAVAAWDNVKPGQHHISYAPNCDLATPPPITLDADPPMLPPMLPHRQPTDVLLNKTLDDLHSLEKTAASQSDRSEDTVQRYGEAVIIVAVVVLLVGGGAGFVRAMVSLFFCGICKSPAEHPVAGNRPSCLDKVCANVMLVGMVVDIVLGTLFFYATPIIASLAIYAYRWQDLKYFLVLLVPASVIAVIDFVWVFGNSKWAVADTLQALAKDEPSDSSLQESLIEHCNANRNYPSFHFNVPILRSFDDDNLQKHRRSCFLTSSKLVHIIVVFAAGVLVGEGQTKMLGGNELSEMIHNTVTPLSSLPSKAKLLANCADHVTCSLLGRQLLEDVQEGLANFHQQSSEMSCLKLPSIEDGIWTVIQYR